MVKKTEIALFEAQGVRYNELLHEIVAEIKMTRVAIANRINSSVIQLYWNIGKRLSLEKIDKGYGGKVVERLSVDLKHEFPDAKGFSPSSLWDMTRLYDFYSEIDPILPQPVAVSENQILPQPVAVLLWGHNRLILSKINDRQEALYYAEAAVKIGWTRDLLNPKHIHGCNNPVMQIEKSTALFAPLKDNTCWLYLVVIIMLINYRNLTTFYMYV